ncbi:MAG: hypothetical protein ACXADB_13165, partial [Candidatus Hermodarchaeia archaeon]
SEKIGIFFTCIGAAIGAPSPPGIGLPETIISCSLCIGGIGRVPISILVVPCGICGVNVAAHTATLAGCADEAINTPCECPK